MYHPLQKRFSILIKKILLRSHLKFPSLRLTKCSRNKGLSIVSKPNMHYLQLLLGDIHHGNRISNYSYLDGELTATNCSTVVVLVSVLLRQKHFGIWLSLQMITSDHQKSTEIIFFTEKEFMFKHNAFIKRL